MGNPFFKQEGVFRNPMKYWDSKMSIHFKNALWKALYVVGFMDIIVEFKKRKKGVEYEEKISPFGFKRNGQFWSMIDEDGKNRTEEGKNEYNHLLRKNTSIYFLLSEIVSLICCVFMLYQLGSWLCQFFGEIAAIFLFT